MSTVVKYHRNFLTGRRESSDKPRRKRAAHKKLNNNYDKLFFNFLVIVLPSELDTQYDRTMERKIKYEFAHKMENMKYKQLDVVLENLCFDDNITLYTLSALFCFHNMSAYYFNNNIIYNVNPIDTADGATHTTYLINYSKDIYPVKKDKLDILKETAYEIKNINKPLYSVTHYKVLELRTIIDAVGIQLDETGKYTKSELYSKISQHFNNALI